MTLDIERGPVLRSALARCITVPTERFATEYWGAKPLLSRADDLGEDFSDLFSVAAVDELVADRGIRTPFVRMAHEGTVLAPSRYTSGGGFGAEIGDQLDSAKVFAEFSAGATLVLQGLHRTWKPLADFTRELVAEVGHPAQVNAYVTPASSRGFDPHYDVHDVFVIQIHGEKHWRIHPPVHENPLRDEPWTDHRDAVAKQATGTPAIDATFGPGDVLYLPRGWIHSAEALGGTSIHLTIGVAALTRWQVVQELVKRAADDPRLRASLPFGDVADAASLDSVVGGTVDLLRSRLEALASEPVADLGRTLSSSVSRSLRPEPVSPIGTVEALANLDASTVVSWRGGLDATLRTDATSVSIMLEGKTVTLPVEASRAIEILRDGEPMLAGSLDGLDPESSLVVARRLVREGVLAIR